METLLIFFGMALVTFFTRYVMIAALDREVPPIVQRWLQYVPPAVLAALIAPAALAPQGRLEVSASAWATLAGALIAWRSRMYASSALVSEPPAWTCFSAIRRPICWLSPPPMKSR